MKLGKAGPGSRNFEARLRQPGLLTDDSDFEDMGRGLIMNSFERLQTIKKVAKHDSEREFYQSFDEEENKYKKLKIPRKLSFMLALVCLIAVAILAYPDNNNNSLPTTDTDEAGDSAFVYPGSANITMLARARALHTVGTVCRKTRSSTRGELKYSGFGNSVTDCDLPSGASLLGLSQLKRDAGPGGLRVGLVNIDEEEQQNWKQFTRGWGKAYSFPLKPVQKNLKWSDFYPEWIDEDSDRTQCPKLPLPFVQHYELTGLTLDVVVVRAPCGQRDVRRLQILLAAAFVASHLSGRDAESMLVLVISECRPLLTLFPCDELLKHKDNLWLFRVNLHKLRQQVALPAGSCESSLRLDNNVVGQKFLPADKSKGISSGRKDVYATLLHSGGVYVCGAVAVAQSIRLSGSKRDLVALVDNKISREQREALQLAGWKLHNIERIRNPKSQPQKYNAWNYSKFRLWQLVQYDKVIYIDSDLLVLQNIDFLFDMPQLSATGNDKSWFNSGVMIIEPSNCTFNLLMDQIDQIESYNGGDQGFLNEIFPAWHRIPRRLNFLKHFWSNETQERIEKTNLFGATDPPLLHVIHYLGRKPWLCYRDYDCNWNSGEYRRYASDVAHARWWQVHDTMAPKLQKQCLLQTKQKAHIEYNRRKAEAARFEDKHWKINITDPREHICAERNCNWENMIKHWGEPSADSLASRRRMASILKN